MGIWNILLHDTSFVATKLINRHHTELYIHTLVLIGWFCEGGNINIVGHEEIRNESPM